MEREKTTAMKEGTLLSSVMKLVTFPLNVMWGQAALVYQTLEAVTASKDSVSLVGWAKKEKILRFLRRIDALTTPIVNAFKYRICKFHKVYFTIYIHRDDKDKCFCHKEDCDGIMNDGIGFCERGNYECHRTEDCSKMAKCSTVQCFCSPQNLCEQQQQLCDEVKAGTESKATLNVAFLFGCWAWEGFLIF